MPVRQVSSTAETPRAQREPIHPLRSLRLHGAILWLFFVLLLVLLAVGAGWAHLTAPARAAERYLAATYSGQHAFKDARIATLARSLDRATLRVTARFETDPDYGASNDPPTWYEYTGQVELARQGLRWLPARGGSLSGDRTYGFFNGTWVATDPLTERSRGPKPCT
jgi:hypothetical protein